MLSANLCPDGWTGKERGHFYGPVRFFRSVTLACLQRAGASLGLRSSILGGAGRLGIGPFFGLDLRFGSAYSCTRVSAGAGVRFFAGRQHDGADYC